MNDKKMPTWYNNTLMYQRKRELCALWGKTDSAVRKKLLGEAPIQLSEFVKFAYANHYQTLDDAYNDLSLLLRQYQNTYKMKKGEIKNV